MLPSPSMATIGRRGGRRLQWRVGILALALAAHGCAVTPQQFATKREGLSDAEVCRAWQASYGGKDRAFEEATQREANRRGLSDVTCTQASNKSRQDLNDAAAALLLIAGAAALIGLAAKGGGGSGIADAVAQTDFDWDWDLFYDANRHLVWACRGVQSGEFSDMARCALKPKVDTRWPSLEAPK